MTHPKIKILYIDSPEVGIFDLSDGYEIREIGKSSGFISSYLMLTAELADKMGEVVELHYMKNLRDWFGYK